MRALPKILRYAPGAFYVAALVVWIFTVWSNWTLMNSGQEFPNLDPDRAALAASIIKSEPFVRGFIEAAYMAANGAILHLLIAIFDRLGVVREAAE